MKKNKGAIVAVIIFIIFWSVLYFGGMISRLNKRYGSVKTSIKESIILKNEIGVVKTVNYSNIIDPNVNIDNGVCTKFRVKTDKGKFKVCAIIWPKNPYDGYYSYAYIIGNKTIYDYPSFNYVEYVDIINNNSVKNEKITLDNFKEIRNSSIDFINKYYNKDSNYFFNIYYDKKYEIFKLDFMDYKYNKEKSKEELLSSYTMFSDKDGNILAVINNKEEDN